MGGDISNCGHCDPADDRIHKEQRQYGADPVYAVNGGSHRCRSLPPCMAQGVYDAVHIRDVTATPVLPS